jgi:hypothetical protein
MYKQRILEAAKKNNGIITAAQSKQLGAPSISLTRMVDEKVLHRVARGVYSLDASDTDPWFFLQSQNPTCVFSYTSALSLQDATDLIPEHPEVTVYGGYNASHFPEGTIIHYVNRDILSLGEIIVKTRYGNEVRCYDMERIICDFIGNRSKIDIELFSKTLQNYANNSQANLRKLMNYAKQMGIYEKVQAIMEVLL